MLLLCHLCPGKEDPFLPRDGSLSQGRARVIEWVLGAPRFSVVELQIWVSGVTLCQTSGRISSLETQLNMSKNFIHHFLSSLPPLYPFVPFLGHRWSDRSAWLAQDKRVSRDFIFKPGEHRANQDELLTQASLSSRHPDWKLQCQREAGLGLGGEQYPPWVCRLAPPPLSW